MDCVFINLDSETERRAAVEANFARVNKGDWKLTRLSATNTRQVVADCIKGKTKPAEKGCFLSHLRAFELSREHASHTLIVEDDILFGEKSLASIELMLNMLRSEDWDLLFTDICVPMIETMLEMYLLRRQLAQENQLTVIKLDRKLPFAGSTAYVVNKNSIEKVLAALRDNPQIDAPYDLTLRQLFWNGRLNGYVIFPFVTSLTESADLSQIQFNNSTKITDVVWNAFRRMIWAERSLDSVTSALDRIEPAFFDSECQAFSKVLACLLSSNFKVK